MGVSKGEKLGKCTHCGKKGVYSKFGWGYPAGTRICRYCKQQPKQGEEQ